MVSLLAILAQPSYFSKRSIKNSRILLQIDLMMSIWKEQSHIKPGDNYSPSIVWHVTFKFC